MKKKISFSIIIVLILITIFTLTACVSNEGESFAKDIKYDMTVNLNAENKTVESVCQINYTHIGDKTKNITLVMNSGAFAEKMPVEQSMKKQAYPMGDSFGEVEIRSVTVKGKKSNAVRNGNLLNIECPKAIRDNSKVEIVVDYKLKLPNNHLRYGYNSYAMQLGNFYPQVARGDEYSAVGDPFYSTADDYNVTISYPKQYKLIASGEQLSKSDDGTIATESYQAKEIRDYAIVLGLSGNIASKSANGFTVNYLYSADNDHMRSIDTALDALTVFNDKYGAYGKTVFNMAEIPFAYGGMEFGGFITINNNVSDWMVREQIIIHETAHQWWYGIVGSDQINHAWQDEGLTEFSVYYYFISKGKEDKAAKFLWEVDRSIKNYHNIITALDLPLDERMDRPLSDFLNNDEYVYASYDKGFAMFECLYTLMGEKKFIAMLNDYVSCYRNKIATKQNMYDLFNKHHSGISSVMETWLNGSVIKS